MTGRHSGDQEGGKRIILRWISSRQFVRIGGEWNWSNDRLRYQK